MTREQDQSEAAINQALESHPGFYEEMSDLSTHKRDLQVTIALYNLQARTIALQGLPLAPSYDVETEYLRPLHHARQQRRAQRGSQYRNRADALGRAASKANAAILFKDHIESNQ